MNDAHLDAIATRIAGEALEMIKKGAAVYEAENYIHELVDDNDWVVLFPKAHKVCQNCNTDLGHQWVIDSTIRTNNYDHLAALIAYGELCCRAYAVFDARLDETAKHLH